MTDKLDPVRPMFELTGRNYLITGGAQGIGFAATRAICEMGGNVAVLDIQERPTAEFEELATNFGVKTSYHQTDLTKQDSLNAGFEKALASLGAESTVVCQQLASPSTSPSLTKLGRSLHASKRSM